jgi:O-antigen/teichoic acid export membrane protein
MQVGRTLFQSMLWRGLYYLTAFIINIVIARHFEASVSGAVYYISSIYALVLLFTGLSLESGIIYFSASQKIPVVKLFSFSISWSLLAAAAAFFIVYIFFNKEFNSIPASLMVFSSITFILGNLLITYCSGFFYAQNNFIVPNCISIIITLILILLIPYNGSSIIPCINDESYFYIYFGSFLLQGICMAVAAGTKYIRSGLMHFLSMQEFRLLVKYCAMAFIGNIIYFLLYRIDYFFVERYCSPEQLGNYIQVSKLVHLFFILPTTLASVVFPLTAGGKKEGINHILTLISRTIFSLYLLVCVLLAVTGNWIFPAVFGESFFQMYEPFLLLIPGILSFSGLFTLTAYFAGKDRLKVNLIGAAYALVIIFAGDIIFIPLFGIKAAALVSSLGYMAYHAYVIFVFKKEHKTRLNQFYIPEHSDWRIISNVLNNAVRKAK